MDKGPNCFQFKIPLKDLTLRIKAHEQINTKMKANNPSSEETFVIFLGKLIFLVKENQNTVNLHSSSRKVTT